MRILSWNINGIRTLPQYHPWNTLRTTQAILEHLEADVVCFQELKCTRNTLDYNWAMPDLFDGFFSFPVNRGGYSGVAVYSNSRTAMPLKAEEGITGKLQPKPPLSAEERISSAYPSIHDMVQMTDDDDERSPKKKDIWDLAYLDAEGRALVLDFGLFVLINTYCPNLTSEARMPFKMNFVRTLGQRVRTLVDEGREVILLGDINICASPLDHADGHLASYASTWYDDRPDRQWLQTLIDDYEGCMVDIIRKFWPHRKGMFTCWNTRISARESNFGTRVDYVLVTRGLLPWIKYGDIQPSLKGSDHCPIHIDLHDEITTETGETVTLRQAMQQDGRKKLPRIAAKFWDEFCGRQTLETFFGKRAYIPPTLSVSVSASGTPTPSVNVDSPTSDMSPLRLPQRATASTDDPPAKRKIVPTSSSIVATGKKKRLKAEQTKLSNWFMTKASSSKSSLDSSPPDAPSSLPSQPPCQPELLPDEDMVEPALGPGYSDAQPTEMAGGVAEWPPELADMQMKSRAEWSQLLAPVPAPRCIVHGETARELTVTKNGPNKGKCFFICSRPLGPGYDKGRAERRRDEVDPRYKCDFFKWSSDVRKEALKEKM